VASGGCAVEAARSWCVGLRGGIEFGPFGCFRVSRLTASIWRVKWR